MKKIISVPLIMLLKVILNLLYCILKIFPVQNKKILFCSRQSNDVPLDFIYLKRKLLDSDDTIRCVTICKNIGRNIPDYIKFALATLRSMYHLATCRVCIIDSYWPAVSLLKHKRGLTVIQIWHAIGKIKQSGRQSVGKVSGRETTYANLFNMHKNYDYIIAGAKEWNKFYCMSFGTTEDKILNFGLPRIDYLVENKEKIKESFFREHPELKDKKVVLYAPTFRRNMQSRWFDISEASQNSDIVIIIKNHPGQLGQYKIESGNLLYADNWKTLDLLCVCDYLITDYSAIALEAASINKPTYYWIYDYEDYISNNGLNIDIKKELGSYAFKNIQEIIDKIADEEYDFQQYNEYKRKYLFEDIGMSTAKITAFIMKLLEEK